jgi:hypothetical protein
LSASRLSSKLNASAPLALALVLTATSCGALKRVHECEQVVESINTEMAEVRFQLPDAGADAPSYTEIAGIYARLSQRLSEIPARDTALSRTLVSYKDVIDRAAEHSRAYAEELARATPSRQERKDRDGRLKRIRTMAKNDLVREASVVRKLNALCHPE